MKKFLFAAIVILGMALASVMGCVSGQPMSDTVELPAHIQRIEAITMETFGVDISIVDYRDDNRTLWCWVDNKSIPGTCDYVVVLGILNKDADMYKPLFIIDSDVSADPCQEGYKMYYEFLEDQKKSPGEAI